MIISSLRAGVAQMWSKRRMLLPFYLGNVVFGLIIMLPVGSLIDGFVGNSLMRERLGAAMDYDAFFEFLTHQATALSAAKATLFLGFGLYWLIALFLSGGALAVFAGDRYTPAGFWGGAGRWFGPFLRLALLSIPVACLLVSLRFVETLGERVFFGADPYEYVIFWGAWIKMGLGYLGLILFWLVFDYARIHMVTAGERRARKALRAGLRFAARHFGRTLALALLLFVAGWALVAAYYVFSGLMTPAGWGIVITLFVGQQLYVVSRMMLRLAGYSGQLILFRSSTGAA